MSTWLGIDTSTDVCAGLAVDGVVVASRLLADRRAHAEQLMPMIVSMLADQGVSLGDVDGIAVGVGPGPFTGLRVGVATAFGIASATGAAVRGVCSLDVVAAQWARAGAPEEFVAVSDARRREVYWARYAAAGSRLAGPFVTAPSEVPALPSCGPGAMLLTTGSCSREPRRTGFRRSREPGIRPQPPTDRPRCRCSGRTRSPPWRRGRRACPWR